MEQCRNGVEVRYARGVKRTQGLARDLREEEREYSEAEEDDRKRDSEIKQHLLRSATSVDRSPGPVASAQCTPELRAGALEQNESDEDNRDNNLDPREDGLEEFHVLGSIPETQPTWQVRPFRGCVR